MQKFDPYTFLEKLQKHDVWVQAEGEDLFVDSPAPLNEKYAGLIREHKQSLLGVLRTHCNICFDLLDNKNINPDRLCTECLFDRCRRLQKEGGETATLPEPIAQEVVQGLQEDLF